MSVRLDTLLGYSEGYIIFVIDLKEKHSDMLRENDHLRMTGKYCILCDAENHTEGYPGPDGPSRIAIVSALHQINAEKMPVFHGQYYHLILCHLRVLA